MLKAMLQVVLSLVLLFSLVPIEWGDGLVAASESWLNGSAWASVIQTVTTDTLFVYGLLAGLCWLLCQFSLLRRAHVFFKALAFAPCQYKLLSPACDAHGCRAPPSL